MINVRIIHETNPRKYFGAIYKLESKGLIRIVAQNRISVFKEWLRAGIKDRSPFLERSKNSISDLLGRLTLPFISSEVVIIGMAPWDVRVLWFLLLNRTNSIIYHTSWHCWSERKVPRNYGFINHVLILIWKRFLYQENVRVVCIHSGVAKSLAEYFGEGINKKISIIPHSLNDEFFSSVRNDKGSVERKFLYVGELSEKKGVHDLIVAINSKQLSCVKLDIVGDGPLREYIKTSTLDNESISYFGKITDKHELVSIFSDNDFLVLMSKKIEGWEELFGIVIIEALAAGLIVLASDHVGPRIIFSGCDYPLFEENDFDGVEKFINHICSNSREKDRLIALGKNISSCYSQARVCDEWYTLLKGGRQ